MTEFKKIKSTFFIFLYAFVIVGIVDMIIQTFSKGHIKIIKDTLNLILN